ncbi:hypothetical protein PMI11_02695, partial [Rhizobium sp. CF142]
GYRRQVDGQHDRRNLGGVIVNPRKSDLYAFAETDRLIILARE